MYYVLSTLKNREENLLNAIEAYQRAENLVPEEDNPAMYAKIQKQLGICFFEISETRDKQENLKKALKHFNSAIKYIKNDAELDEIKVYITQINKDLIK
ncbi:hypothetical protein [Ruminiclostridium josui]|nr:hypothetical protein [Ruminiclostridium josui]